MSKMTALALIVGNANYPGRYKLNNAVNDAKDIAAKLMKLGFAVKRVTDCTIETFERNVSEYGEELKGYDVGLFYFSGHGLQSKGKNYLTAIDTNFNDEASVHRTAYYLGEIIEYMQVAQTKINIIILDACRDNPLADKYRSIGSEGLAPIHAPKGTIIAFSTSPGEKAKDSGSGNNSIYTGALLNHIEDANIPLEEFFKRVRTSVFDLSDGKQTSWEHTSLIGNFFFNSGQLIHSPDLPYRDDCISDKDFISSGSAVDNIITEMKSHDWYKQKAAIAKLNQLSPATIDDSSKFLVGRNILQVADGTERSALWIINNLDSWVSKYSVNGENHVLNGILYEIYFNPEGVFRNGNYKSDLLDAVCKLQTNKSYIKSFEFIKNQLSPFQDYIFYIPGISPKACAIEIKGEEEIFLASGKEKKAFKVKSIKHENVELMEPYKDEEWNVAMVSKDEFMTTLCKQLCVLKSMLRVSCNEDLKDFNKICIPDSFKLYRQD